LHLEEEESFRDFNFNNLRGRKTLITGDVGTGKTVLTANLLDEAVSHGFGSIITVLDIAPTVNLGVMDIGSNLEEFSRSISSVRYVRPSIIRAPRLEGRSSEEVLRLAEENAYIIDRWLDELIKNVNPVLFVNDLTLYLQAGEPQRIIELFKASETVVANAYRGQRLRNDQGSGLSEREERALGLVEEKAVDRVIRLPLKRG
jgi:KaiC/GvpD/RAD55 family RecA-like ATPase